MPDLKCNPVGSVWHRWEPHIHTPGTARNDGYTGVTLEQFCATVANCVPSIRALGITDYLSIDRYKEIKTLQLANHLPNVELIFPNVEFRFSIGTGRGNAVNAHLLFSPDEPDHINEITRFLGRLRFLYLGDEYGCNRADLIRLGRKHKPSIPDSNDDEAYEHGGLQFKISMEVLLAEFSKNEWAKNNCLIGVAAGADGTAGTRTPEGAFDAMRITMEAASHVIFSGSASDRKFWLGLGVASIQHLEETYGGAKPCLHGSDAHDLAHVGKPEQDKFCWIKGDLTFEALRQACIEPEGRTYIGATAPRGGYVEQTLDGVSVTNANWITPPYIPLNSGLIAVIGARGSGKTALTDLIAVGAYSMGTHVTAKSFVRRAEALLHNSDIALDWENGDTTQSSLTDFAAVEEKEYPRVQYLSQQFVDELCSSEGIADKLMHEIKRVVFNAHPVSDREGADTFDELFEIRCQNILLRRERLEEELARVTNSVIEQHRLKQSIGGLKKDREELENRITKDTRERSNLVSKGEETRAARHLQVQQALSSRRSELDRIHKKSLSLRALKLDIEDFRSRTATGFISAIKRDRADAGLTDRQWDSLTPTISSECDALIAGCLTDSLADEARIQGPNVEYDPSRTNISLVAADADLSSLTVSLLHAESARLASLIGVDKLNAQKYRVITERIQSLQKQLESLNKQITRAEAADDELRKLGQQRRITYRGVFEAFSELEAQLADLYDPLRRSLDSEAGTLGKLKFVVRRRADIEKWAGTGERLLDLRKQGPFRGSGSLTAAANALLTTVWETGSAEDASEAVENFIKQYGDDLRKHMPDAAVPKEWGAKIWGWLVSTDHITVSYQLEYNGIDIQRHSPGTRGIVLLLLYLAIDHDDTRPLIVDQPEENLDPQSVYRELVPKFREAKTRRQIIIVTHNANLVVNTDTDQVIVATAGEHRPGELPEITYDCGGLENPAIRQKVCEILEGGEQAFRERARRLRVRFS